MNSALRELLDFFGIDRISLLCLTPDKTCFFISHNADAAGYSSYPVETLLPVSIAPYGADMLQRMKFFSFSTLDDLPEEEAIDKQTFEAWGIQSGRIHTATAPDRGTIRQCAGTKQG
ncbi:MAG: hypothetical protein ABFD50_22490 [Smithella sp.]